MVNDIVADVACALNDAFGDSYAIYQNDVEQGLSEPCFFIAVLQTARTPIPGGRYEQTVPLDIAYFPARDGGNREMQEVANTLFDVLEFIEASDGGLRHGVDLAANIVDGVLHFSVAYQLFLRRPKEETRMAELHTDVGVEGGSS